MLHSAHFCEAIATQFLQFSRHSKMISSYNFKLISSQNTKKKIGKLTFETTLVYYTSEMESNQLASTKFAEQAQWVKQLY